MARKTVSLLGAFLLLSSPVMAQNAGQISYDSEEMQKARIALQHETGGQRQRMLFMDRLEYLADRDTDTVLWDAGVWWGGDIHKIGVHSEGEYLSDTDVFEEVEWQIFYMRAISTYFDLQLGYRYDMEPHPQRHFAILGIQGLLPYRLEADATVFLDEHGDLSMRLEAEYEWFFSQRIILQARTEINLAAGDEPEYSVSSGINMIEAGLRLRWEVYREFAPYVGFSLSRMVGESADREGESAESISFLAGLKLRF